MIKIGFQAGSAVPGSQWLAIMGHFEETLQWPIVLGHLALQVVCSDSRNVVTIQTPTRGRLEVSLDFPSGEDHKHKVAGGRARRSHDFGARRWSCV